jgi:hypothetical protein
MSFSSFAPNSPTSLRKSKRTKSSILLGASFKRSVLRKSPSMIATHRSFTLVSLQVYSHATVETVQLLDVFIHSLPLLTASPQLVNPATTWSHLQRAHSQSRSPKVVVTKVKGITRIRSHMRSGSTTRHRSIAPKPPFLWAQDRYISAVTWRSRHSGLTAYLMRKCSRRCKL